MDRVALDDVELEYEIRGNGEPVVFVHHGAGVDWFVPLMRVPALADRYRIVHYHRAGYAGSSPSSAPLTFALEAVRFRALAAHLGLTRVTSSVIPPAPVWRCKSRWMMRSECIR